MKNQSWKAALWDISWAELHNGKYSAQGYCTFDESNGAALEIPFGDLSENRTLSETGMYTIGYENEHYDYLYGMTQDGIRLVLSDVTSNGISSYYPGGNQETLRANTIFASRHEFNPDTPIASISIEFEGLRDWMGLHYRPAEEEGRLHIEANGISKSLQLYSGDDYVVEIRYGTRSPRVTTDGMMLSLYAAIHINCLQDQFFNEVWTSAIWKTQSLFAFFYGTCPSIERLSILFKDDTEPVNAYRSGFPANNRSDYRNVPVAFSAIHDSLSRIATSWFSLTGDERYAARTLTSLLGTWSMPIGLQLFAANTMVEAIARSGESETAITATQINALKESIRETVDESLFDRACGLLSLLKYPSYSMLLDSIYCETGVWGRKLIPDWRRFKKEQVEFRHSEAHGHAEGDEYETMANHYHAQIVITYIALMKRLGFSDEDICRFEESSFLNVARWRIAREYAISETEADDSIDDEGREPAVT